MNVKEVPQSAMILLPPPAGRCPECAREHDPQQPHDAQSFYYQFKFNWEHGRKATWADAMAHCSDETKAIWTEELRKLGVEVVPHAGKEKGNETTSD